MVLRNNIKIHFNNSYFYLDWTMGTVYAYSNISARYTWSIFKESIGTASPTSSSSSSSSEPESCPSASSSMYCKQVEVSEN